jgi:regulation of enolase protein 1 (concanavalin A-like superfamily)
MYRLCTGRLPFEGESVMAVLTALSTDDPPRPAEWQPGLPQALDDLVMRLLAKKPEGRPESAEVVVQEIRTIEREWRAEQQEAERFAGLPLLPVNSERQIQAPADEQPLPSQSPVKSSARRHTIGRAAAVLAMFAVAAVVDFVFVGPRKTATRIIAAEHTSMPTADESAARSITTKSDQSESQAQPEGSQEQRKPRLDSGIVPEMKIVARPEMRQSIVANNPGPPPAVQPGMVGPPQPETPPPTSRSTANDSPQQEKTGVRPPYVDVPGDKDTLAAQAQATAAKKNWKGTVDPDGDCQVEVDQRENKLRIIVPGKTHLLSAEVGRVNAPRVLRDIDGDFDVNVRVTGTNHPGGKATTTLYPPYHGAGILLWQDPENYVRLELAADLHHAKARPYVNFEYRKDGALAFSRGMANDDGSSRLRLRRRGDEILASFSSDGARWTSFAPVIVKLNDRLEVGVSAINSSTKSLTALIEGFEISENRGSKQ